MLESNNVFIIAWIMLPNIKQGSLELGGRLKRRRRSVNRKNHTSFDAGVVLISRHNSSVMSLGALPRRYGEGTRLQRRWRF